MLGRDGVRIVLSLLIIGLASLLRRPGNFSIVDASQLTLILFLCFRRCRFSKAKIEDTIIATLEGFGRNGLVHIIITISRGSVLFSER